MTYADTSQRTALIKGLRALADYLERNPEVPAPIRSDVYTFPAEGIWAEMRAEIDIVAARLGATGRKTCGGHYIAVRSFGPIDYRAVAIPRDNDEQSE
jgi:hypothetical protein